MDLPNKQEQPPKAANTDGSGDEPSPRGFAIGTGLLFVVVGSVLFLGACCLWSFSGFLISAEPQANQVSQGQQAGLPRQAGSPVADSARWPTPAGWPTQSGWPALLAGACMIGTFLGGSALFAAGVGLYGERPSGGPIGFFVVVALAIFFGIASVLVWQTGQGWGKALVPGVLSLVLIALVPFAIGSWDVMRRFPPPANQNEVRDDQIANLLSRTSKRRR